MPGGKPMKLGANYQHVVHVMHLKAAIAAAVLSLASACMLLLVVFVFPKAVVQAACCFEACFACCFLCLYLKYNKQPACHRPKPHTENDLRCFKEFIRHQPTISRFMTIDTMVSKWYGVPASEIKRENVADLLAYGFLYKTRKQLQQEGLGHLPDQLVSVVEYASNTMFEEGRNRKIRFMGHLWEGLRCHYRPGMFYVFMEFLGFVKHVMLLAAGFCCREHAGFVHYTYGIETLDALSATETPVVFLHGVGVGLLPYVTVLMRLAACGQPVLALEVRHLSMRLCTHIRTEDEVVEGLVDVMRHHRISSAHVMAHSYGTLMASRLIQMYPVAVQKLCLIDPVCFCMFNGKLVKQFVYSNPFKSGCPPLIWFIARDIHHAASVARNFFWTQLNLWPHHLPNDSLIVFSGKDHLVPVQESMMMLEEEPAVEMMLHPGHHHADFLIDPAWQDKIIERFMTKTCKTTSMAHGRHDSADSLLY